MDFNLSNLGGSTFTVRADVSEFEKSLRQAEADARKFHSSVSVAMQGAGANIQRASKSAGMGLLLLSQGIEDAQYGLSAVVNNVPGVVMALGGSMGLAGAISLSAVAVNTWVNNWDDARQVFGGFISDVKSGMPVMEGLGSAFSDASASIFVSASNLSAMRADWGEIGQITEARERAKAEVEDRSHRAAVAGERIGALRTEGERAKGKMFADVLAEYGPERLKAEMETRAGLVVRKLTEEQRQKIREGHNLAIADAMTGRFGPGLEQQFGKRFTRIFGERSDEAERKAWMADIAKIEKDMRREAEKSRQDARRGRVEALQDRQEELMEQRHDIQQRIRDRGRMHIFGSGLEFANAVQTSAGAQIPKEQLGKLKSIDDTLNIIRRDLKKEQRARFQ